MDILGLKEKLKLRYNINNRNEENYKVKEEAFSSLMKIIKTIAILSKISYNAYRCRESEEYILLF